MKNALKVTMVIVGPVIGAGFASRARNFIVFSTIWT